MVRSFRHEGGTELIIDKLVQILPNIDFVLVYDESAMDGLVTLPRKVITKSKLLEAVAICNNTRSTCKSINIAEPALGSMGINQHEFEKLGWSVLKEAFQGVQKYTYDKSV